MSPVPHFATRPLYLQVRDELAARIASGAWKPGQALPSEQELARTLSVSQGTVRKALDILCSEHLINRQQGRGTFVSDHASDLLALRFSNIRNELGQRIAGEVSACWQAPSVASPDEQCRLKIGPTEAVVRTRRLRKNAGRPFVFEEAVLAVGRFSGLAPETVGNYRLSALAQQYGLLLGRGVERVSAVAATHEVAGKLRVEAGTPVLLLDRLVFDVGERPVEWRRGHAFLAYETYQADLE